MTNDSTRIILRREAGAETCPKCGVNAKVMEWDNHTAITRVIECPKGHTTVYDPKPTGG